LESVYKIDTGCDHVAKFCGDWPRELGDYALKKKERHYEHFISPPVTILRTGGLISWHSFFLSYGVVFSPPRVVA